MKIEFDTIEEFQSLIEYLGSLKTDLKQDGKELTLAKKTASQKWCAKFNEVFNSNKYDFLTHYRYSSLEWVDKIPEGPGVYFFFDEKNEIIYIGSSNNLKVRVEQSYHERNGSKEVHSIAWVRAFNIETARDIEGIMIRKYNPLKNVVKPTCGNDDSELPNPFELEKHIVHKWSPNNDGTDSIQSEGINA